MAEASPSASAFDVRISHDKTGAGLRVEHQEADCRELAARLGWSVTEMFCDNDLRAYSGKPRYRTPGERTCAHRQTLSQT
jgi:site-specific DNA recombinase